MKPVERATFTEEEYLEREASSEEKHDYVDGQILAMSGGTPRHNLIASNIVAALHRLLRGKPCLVFGSDQRVHVGKSHVYTYPDASVVCGRLERHPKSPSTILNPMVVLEVLSESTAAYDRWAKFVHYRRIPSLQEYLFVSQAERRVEHYRRADGEQWLLTDFQEDASVRLPALDIELPLAEVYEKVDLLGEEA